MKKIITFIISLVLVFSVIPAYSADYPDTEGEAYEKAADVLLNLNILYSAEDSSFDSTAYMSRAEAVVTMVRLMNITDVTAVTTEHVENTYFYDVPTDHWAVEDINAALDLGIISMNEQRQFFPDEDVTGNEFVKMLISAMGYDELAQNKGGYPGGYYSVAVSKKLLRGVENVSSDAIGRRDIAVILYNALDANVGEVVSINADHEIGYDTSSTLLEVYFKMEKRTGIVTANSITALNGTGTDDEGRIKIDGIEYKCKEPDLGKYIGREVEYYVTLDGVDSEVKYVTDLDMNNDIRVLSKPYDEYSYDLDQKRYIIRNDTKTIYEELEATAYIIFNGKSYLNCPAEKMCPDIGDVTLIDNDGNGKYDVVNIMNYKNMSFESYSAYDEKLYCSDSHVIDVSDDVELEIAFFGTDEKEFSELYSGTVLSAAVSEDGKYCRINVSTDYAFGEVEEYTEEGGYDIVKIDGKDYMIGTGVNKDNKLIGLRTTGVFYLDFRGMIADFSYNDGAMQYGYLQKMLIPQGLSAVMNFRIFTSEGIFKNFTAADKIYVDNKWYKANDESMLTEKIGVQDYANGTKGGVSQLVRYKINSNGEIICLDTVNDYSAGDKTLHCPLGTSVAADFRSDAKTMGARIYVGEADVFSIPVDKDDEELYKIDTTSIFSNDEEYTFDAYSTYSDLSADVLIVEAAENENIIKKSNALAIVETVRKALNADGEEIYRLLLWQDGTYVNVDVERDHLKEIAAGMNSGDACLYSVDKTGKASGLSVFYSYDNDVMTASGTLESSKNSIVGGYVMNKENNLITFAVAEPSDIPDSGLEVNVLSLHSATVVCYDPDGPRGGRVSVVSPSVLKGYDNTGSADYVVVKAGYACPNCIYIPLR